MCFKFWESKKARERKRSEREYLDRLDKFSQRPIPKNTPITREYLDRFDERPISKKSTTTVFGITCPNCSSNRIGSAGYGNRFECLDCGHIFT